jgi:hypothetical protein
VGSEVGADDGELGAGDDREVKEDASLQPDIHSDAQHDKATSRRVTTRCPPEIEATDGGTLAKSGCLVRARLVECG